MTQKRVILLLALAFLFVGVGYLNFGCGPSTHAASMWYVSRLGNGADGRSWATAWTELDRIDWHAVEPGDIILLDGGETAMVYESTLTLGKSGMEGAPITVKLADEPGRNGKAVIFGGRTVPLGYCGESGYGLPPARGRGIDSGANAWLVINGTKWGGIALYGHNDAAIRLRSESHNIAIRNVEVYDNGWWAGSEPDGPGIDLSGANNTVERAIIHDNGQDAFQSGGGISNFTLRDSWLYNLREHPNRPDRPFNYCTHSDGMQVWGGGHQSGMLIEHSVIGPGFMQGVLLGEPVGTSPATVDNVTIRDSLFIKADTTNIDTAQTAPVNWLVENVTSVERPGDHVNNIALKGGSGHSVRNSITVGGYQNYFASQPDLAGNCWDLNTYYAYGPGDLKVDPQFVRLSQRYLALDDDYTVQNPQCQGRGSSLTSVGALFAEPPLIATLPA